METRDCERPNVDRWHKSQNAGFGFPPTEHAMFDFEQCDLSKRFQRDFERHRFCQRDWDFEFAATLSLQRQGFRKRGEFSDTSAAASCVRQSECAGGRSQTGLGRPGASSDGFPAVNFEIDGCPSRRSLEELWQTEVDIAEGTLWKFTIVAGKRRCVVYAGRS